MKKSEGYGIWGLGQWSLIPSTGPKRNSSGVGQKSAGTFSSPRYPIRDKDMGKIHKAASSGIVAKVQHALILRKNGVNDKDKNNRTALHFACAYGHPQVVTLLLERKCDINIRDDDNCTPLIKAVQCQEEKCVDILLEHGADPNAMDASGHTALHYAIYSKNTSLAAKLLSHNANIEAKNKDGLTPLLLALIENKQRMAEFLVEKKANIHAVDKTRRTALMLAVRYKSTNIVRLLLQQGIDVFYKDASGRTAADHALVGPCNINRQIIFEHEEKMLKMSQDRNLAEADSAVMSKEREKQEQLCGSESDQCQVEEEQMEHENIETKVSKNPCDDDDSENVEEEEEEKKEQEKEAEEEEGEGEGDGDAIQRSHGKAENQQFPLQGNKEHTELSKKPEPDDPWPSSDEENFTFDTKNDPKVNLKELWKAFQKSRKNEKYDIGKPQSITLFEDSDSENQTKKQDIKIGGAEGGGGGGEEEEESLWDSETISQSCPQRCADHLPRATDEREKHTINEYVDEPDIEMTPEEEQKRLDVKENNELLDVPKANLKELWKTFQESRTYGLGGEEDVELSCSSENISESLPQRYVGHLTRAEDEGGKHIINGPADEPNIEMISEKGQNRLDFLENNHQLNVPKENLTEPWKAAQLSQKNSAICAVVVGEDEDVESPWDSESSSKSLPQKCAGHVSGAEDEREKDTVDGHVEDIPEKYSHLKPTNEMKDHFPNQAVEAKDVKILKQEQDTEMALEEIQKKLDDSENHQPLNVPKGNLTEPRKAAQQSRKNQLVEEEDVSSSWDFEHISENFPQKCVEHLSRPEDQRGKDTMSGLAKDLSTEPHLEMTSEEMQKRLAGSERGQTWLSLNVEEKKNKNNERAMSETVRGGPAAKEEDGDDDSGTDQQREREKTDNQRFPTRGNEENDEPTKKTSKEKNKVQNQISAVDDLDDLPQPYEVASEECELPDSNYENILLLIEQLTMEYKDSISLSKIRNAVHSYKRLFELKKSHHKQVQEQIDKMENTISRLQKELSETKYMKSQLEHEKGEQEGELCKLRIELEQEKKRGNTHWFYEKIKEELEEKEEQYKKEVEANEQLKICLTKTDMELKTVRDQLNQVLKERNDIEKQFHQQHNTSIAPEGVLVDHLCEQRETEMTQNQVSASHEGENELLHKTHMLQDEITMLRLEIDTIKNQNQEKETKYLRDIEDVKIENDNLLRTIKRNEEIFTKTVIQYSEQLSILLAENAMLNSKCGNQRQNKELETEVKSDHSQLPPTLYHNDQNQTLKRDLELAFQRARAEWSHLEVNMNCNVSIKRKNNEILSEQLYKSKGKFDNLEIEVYHPREELERGEKTLVLEHVQKSLSQTQCEIKEIEHTNQTEQGKVNKYSGKQHSTEEEISHLQTENMLLQQQLHYAHYKDDSKSLVVSIQDHFNNIMDKLQAETEKTRLILEDINEELTKECNHLKTRLYLCESENTERESQEDQDEHSKALPSSEKLWTHLQKVELENIKLKIKIKKQTMEIEELQKNLLSGNWTQSEHQKCLEELRENSHASIRSTMELRIKDLESEFPMMKAQDNSNAMELKKYKRLYQEDTKFRKSLSVELNKLHWTNILKEHNKNPLERQNIHVQEFSCVRDFTRKLRHNRPSIEQPSNGSIESYMTKMLLYLNMDSFEPFLQNKPISQCLLGMHHKNVYKF